jgi:hypothetical protein
MQLTAPIGYTPFVTLIFILSCYKGNHQSVCSGEGLPSAGGAANGQMETPIGFLLGAVDLHRLVALEE